MKHAVGLLLLAMVWQPAVPLLAAEEESVNDEGSASIASTEESSATQMSHDEPAPEEEASATDTGETEATEEPETDDSTGEVAPTPDEGSATTTDSGAADEPAAPDSPERATSAPTTTDTTSGGTDIQDSTTASTTSSDTAPDPVATSTPVAPPVSATTTPSDSGVLNPPAPTATTTASSTPLSETGTTTDTGELEPSLAGASEPEPEPEPTVNEETTAPDPTADTAPQVPTPRPKEVASSSADTEPVNVVTNNDNRYQFGDSECVSVGDGAFYCSKNTAGATVGADGMFAARDEGGDLEIYLRRAGAVTQITDNSFEDAAPYLDEHANELVFHRLLEGRYQIIRYDISTGDETQLTNSRENNMQPAQGAGVTVWQRWVTDNWEIALSDGEDVHTITDNDHHDVAPTVRDGYVMWHTTNDSGEKMLSVYELATGHQETIADPDGGHVENPRFVLVYDTAYENGDIVTKEYDPETGEIRLVGSDPAPAPIHIPEPDPVEETRALINSKTSGRSEVEDAVDGLGNTTPATTASTTPASGEEVGTSTPAVNDTNASTTEPINAPIDMTASSSEPLPLTDYDLIVEPMVTSGASTTASEPEL